LYLVLERDGHGNERRGIALRVGVVVVWWLGDGVVVW
jgi:hypothetical protein